MGLPDADDCPERARSARTRLPLYAPDLTRGDCRRGDPFTSMFCVSKDCCDDLKYLIPRSELVGGGADSRGDKRSGLQRFSRRARLLNMPAKESRLRLFLNRCGCLGSLRKSRPIQGASPSERGSSAHRSSLRSGVRPSSFRVR